MTFNLIPLPPFPALFFVTSFGCVFLQAKKDETSNSALEDEAIEVEHLLAEPKNEHVSVDGVLSFGEENLGKCLQIEDFSCGFDYGLTSNSGNICILFFFFDK